MAGLPALGPHNLRHRVGGPAVHYPDDSGDYYIGGQQLPNDQLLDDLWNTQQHDLVRDVLHLIPTDRVNEVDLQDLIDAVQAAAGQ